MLCEDYPCCGHGPPPQGDGGGCPEVDEDGGRRFRCVLCGVLMEAGVTSSICDDRSAHTREMISAGFDDEEDFW